MPFQVMRNWAKWSAGSIISGGEIAEYLGSEPTPSKSDMQKLQLPAPKKGISDERITELINRGVLFGTGDDMHVLVAPEIPFSTNTFDERVEILGKFNRLQPQR